MAVGFERMTRRLLTAAQQERTDDDLLSGLLDSLLVVRPDLAAEVEATRLGAGLRGDDFWTRSSTPHLTCSTMVVDRDSRVVLTLHKRHGTWQQVGGHPAAGERDPRESALREASEETGLRSILLIPVPVDLSIHTAECPVGENNLHHDLCFIALTRDSDLVRSPESRALEWVPAARVDDFTGSSRVRFLTDLAASVAAVVEWSDVPHGRGVARANALHGH